MNILRSILLSLTLLFVFTGCGGGASSSGTSSDANLTELTVVLPSTTSEITTNSETIDIEVKVIGEGNTLYQTGDVYVVYPDSIQSGRDIGSFPSSNVAISNGVATFSYTGPGNIFEDTSDIEFSFYHEDNPTVTANYVVTINPDQADLTNYSLNSSDDNVTMDLESSKLMIFSITDDTNLLIDDSQLTSIKITSLNPNAATLEDSLGHIDQSSLTITNENSVRINVNSKTISGIVPIKVVANFLDTNGKSQTLSKTFNILIFSGPPSAMSISNSTSVEKDQNNAKYIEKFSLTVTDKYGNRVNTNPAVSMGLITGFTQASSATDTNNMNYLYVGTGISGGTINSSTNSFTAKTNIFENIDPDNDVLVTFGTNDEGYTYNASGKWDILSKNSSSNTLFLSDDYSGDLTSNLGFAVGHNYRQIICSNSGEEAVANVYPDNNDVIVPESGSMTINIEYDYYLVGKTVMLWVNLVGENRVNSEIVKIGESKKIGLKGDGLTLYENGSNLYDAGDTGKVRINIQVGDTTEYYRNGRFGYVIDAPDINFTVIGDSMDNDLDSCVDSDGDATDGKAYVDVRIDDPAEAAGEITFKSLLTIEDGEF